MDATWKEYCAWFLALPWRRLLSLQAGVQIGLGTLIFAQLLGWTAALRHLVLRLRGRSARRKHKKWRLAVLALLAVLLPGGLVGALAATLVMGKGNWRRDAVFIVGASILPGGALIWVSSSEFPPSWDAHGVLLAGIAGIGFAVLQLWALVKILRQTWGEPYGKIPGWPPLALWLQLFLLADLVLLLLTGGVPA